MLFEIIMIFLISFAAMMFGYMYGRSRFLKSLDKMEKFALENFEVFTEERRKGILNTVEALRKEVIPSG